MVVSIIATLEKSMSFTSDWKKLTALNEPLNFSWLRFPDLNITFRMSPEILHRENSHPENVDEKTRQQSISQSRNLQLAKWEYFRCPRLQSENLQPLNNVFLAFIPSICELKNSHSRNSGCENTPPRRTDPKSHRSNRMRCALRNGHLNLRPSAISTDSRKPSPH